MKANKTMREYKWRWGKTLTADSLWGKAQGQHTSLHPVGLTQMPGIWAESKSHFTLR